MITGRDGGPGILDNGTMIWLTELRQSLRRLITSPIDEMDRGRRAMRYAVDLVRYSSHQLHKDRASQTAAALTYHTLFSLLPMLVLMLVIMRFFVGEAQRDQLKDSAVEYLVNKWLAGTPPLTLTVDPLGLGDTPMAIEQDPLAPSGEDWLDGMSANQREFEEARATFGNKIHDWLNKFEQVNFGSISVFGVLLFFFAATNLLTTVERSFNAIYGTSQSRSWIKRFPVYFTVVLLSPVLLATGQ
jgi:membrane protein